MQFEFKNLVCQRKAYQSRQQAVIYLLRECPAKNYLFLCSKGKDFSTSILWVFYNLILTDDTMSQKTFTNYKQTVCDKNEILSRTDDTRGYNKNI